MIDKVNLYTKGCLRASPCLVVVVGILSYLVFQIKFGLYFTVYMLIIDIIAHLLKKIFEKCIYKSAIILPLLGKGKRPEGAKYSACFIDEKDLEGREGESCSTWAD